MGPGAGGFLAVIAAEAVRPDVTGLCKSLRETQMNPNRSQHITVGAHRRTNAHNRLIGLVLQEARWPQ